jgi:outer membrane protein insertion porin family
VAQVTDPSADLPKVTDVVIVGNKKVSTDVILQALRIKKGDTFYEANLRGGVTDIVNLGFFYEDQVTGKSEPVAEGVKVTYTVVEHPVVTRIDITGNTALSKEDLTEKPGSAKLLTRVGTVLNTTDVAKDLLAIAAVYRAKGYEAIVSGAALGPSEGASSVPDRATLEKMVTPEGVLTITVIELRVESMTVTGLRKTYPNVVIRELKVRPGDLYDTNKLAKDLQRLANLDLFESIGPPRLLPGSDLGFVRIDWPVVEKKTGQISLGLGFSSPQGIVGRAEFAESNFRGKGEGLNLLAELGGRAGRSSFEVSFFEPYIDSKHTSLNVSLFNKVIYRFANSVITTPTLNNTDSLFNEVRKGGTISLSRPFTEQFTGVVGLRHENTNLNVPSSLANNPTEPAFIFQSGSVDSFNLRGILDNRDLALDPAKGGMHSLTGEFGYANVEKLSPGMFMKFTADLRRYMSGGKRIYAPVAEKKQVLAARLLIGTASGSVPFVEQFFVGGADTLRGYLESRFWGPHMFLASMEFRKPLGGGNAAFTGVAFVDVGDAWGTDFFLPDASDPSHRFRQHSGFSPHGSIGAGLRISTPIGPLRLDYAYGSEGGRTHFSIGHVF